MNHQFDLTFLDSDQAVVEKLVALLYAENRPTDHPYLPTALVYDGCNLVQLLFFPCDLPSNRATVNTDAQNRN